MYLFKASISCAAIVALVGAGALAQSVADSTSPDGVQLTACLADDDCGGISCCDSETDVPCGSGCGGCSSSRWCQCGELGDPWTLTGDNCCLKIGGWFSTGAYSNAHGAASNGPLGFNNVGDGFTFNQAWIYAEKAADTGGCGVDWGFRVDYVFGVDGPDTQAFGSPDDVYDNPWDTARDYGSALPQLYGEVAINDLSIKFGHFYTNIGYEVVGAPDNFFYSHAYTMYYGEPFTHTGVLASYEMCNDVTVHAGWTQGWDTGFDNTFRADTFLGGLSVPLTCNSTLTWAVSAGDLGFNAGDVYMNSLVLECTPTCRLTYVLQHDYGTIHGGPAEGTWYGINQYLLYALNDCWGAGLRFEWFRDDDATRVVHDRGTSEGDYYALTAGLNWKPHTNVIVRPEIRYDWFHGVSAPDAEPFNFGDATDQLSGGFDLIVTY